MDEQLALELSRNVSAFLVLNLLLSIALNK